MVGDIFTVYFQLFFMVRHAWIYQSFLNFICIRIILKHGLLGPLPATPSTPASIPDALLGQEWDPKMCITNKLGTTLENLCTVLPN